ncbi:hypothetical protein Tco_1248449 [Tanacetum coccineum]
MVKTMASMNTRLNIENLDWNIVQKHGDSKQVGFKQLGPGVETGVHGVYDEKRVWFEVELQGAQGDREAEVFQVSNDDTTVAQRRLEDKQPEEKTNTDCLVKEQEKEYLGGRSRRSGLSKVLWAEDTTISTYLVNRSPSSAIGFKKPIDMLGFLGCLTIIKQGILEPVKVKWCIFLGYRKGIWVSMKVFIGSGVGTGSMQVLHGFEFKLARDREQHLACELFGYREDSDREQHLALIPLVGFDHPTTWLLVRNKSDLEDEHTPAYYV